MTDLDPKWIDVGLKTLEMLAIVFIAAVTWVNLKAKASLGAVSALREEHEDDVRQMATERATDRADIEAQIARVERALSKQINQLRSEVVNRVDTIEIDVRELRTRLELVPGAEDIDRVHARVDDVAQGVATLTGTVNEMNYTLHMIQDHLMRASK
jgi:iron-sulfur cluster repair protein YtfE (RIC family)